MIATLLIAAIGMVAWRCMSNAPRSVMATSTADGRAGLDPPVLHEEALPYVGVVAMTPHGMMPSGPYEAGPPRYEMRSFFKSVTFLRFFGNYHIPCLSPGHLSKAIFYKKAHFLLYIFS